MLAIKDFLTTGWGAIFSAAHGHYFYLSVGLLIIFYIVALIFSIVSLLVMVQPIIKIHSNRECIFIMFSVCIRLYCGRNFSRPIFLKFYFCYVSRLNLDIFGK